MPRATGFVATLAILCAGLTAAPAEVVMKLSFVPGTMQLGGKRLERGRSAPAPGWAYDPATRLLTIQHGAGEISVLR